MLSAPTVVGAEPKGLSGPVPISIEVPVPPQIAIGAEVKVKPPAMPVTRASTFENDRPAPVPFTMPTPKSVASKPSSQRSAKNDVTSIEKLSPTAREPQLAPAPVSMPQNMLLPTQTACTACAGAKRKTTGVVAATANHFRSDVRKEDIRRLGEAATKCN